MKFDRLELIKRLTETADAREAQAVRELDGALAKERARRAQYVADTTEAWSEFVLAVRRRLRKGEPIVEDDVPKELRPYGRELRLFRPADTGSLRRPEQLRALVRVLEASQDETVSLAEIQRNGFTLGKLL
jgi:hypothetical protein